MPNTSFSLLLASSSPARRTLLSKLGLPFQCASPDIDESPLAGEDAPALVYRLAHAKAQALASQHKGLIIGSDQVVAVDGLVLSKPGTHQNAVEQLGRLSGKTVIFYTGLCLLNTLSGHCQILVEPFQVTVRPLSQEAIERYLQKEQPYDCAGSFKSEGLGITLFERFEGRDPNSLVGLPLMALTDMLVKEGIFLP
jgi:septum formation protein